MYTYATLRHPSSYCRIIYISCVVLMAMNCAVRCTVRDGVCIRAEFEDGTQLDIPEELVARSKTLKKPYQLLASKASLH